MSHGRLLLGLGMMALLFSAPSSISADHCGGTATITPWFGPPDTVFVFTTNLGAPSDLRLYRDGELVRSVFLAESDVVSYSILTGPGDAGAWRVRVEARGAPECIAEARFSVLRAPDTSTEGATPPAALPWLLWIVAGAAFTAGIRRFAAQGPYPAIRE